MKYAIAIMLALTATSSWAANTYNKMLTDGSNNLISQNMFWNDLRTPITMTNVGGTRPPVLKVFRDNGAGSQGVFLFAFENQSTANLEQEVYFTLQMPHGWNTATHIDPHLHYTVAAASTPASDDTIIFGLERTCGGLTGVFPTTSIVVSTQTVPAPYTAGYMAFTEFTPVAELSSLCSFRLFRNSSTTTDNYAHDVFGVEVDFHYQSDYLGSRQELIK